MFYILHIQKYLYKKNVCTCLCFDVHVIGRKINKNAQHKKVLLKLNNSWKRDVK